MILIISLLFTYFLYTIIYEWYIKPYELLKFQYEEIKQDFKKLSIKYANLESENFGLVEKLSKSKRKKTKILEKF